ncbi:hypothetical protein FOPG_08604 [Fusarium oxysporum f. sp. conglutinans race 2 54008]|uniref:HIG1 domain-containing protein n=3 Tax=Fusarium oxysporum f. sp. conglutinans TaxID=100902 RepID=A0A8H6GBL2_FUSOX|nr:hypothetical protein FOXB_14830 [Fusarium oxysporum f. sp. conglutinans Fo5176]EXL76707.1 hypothetical protein FOPG_08604 [Fusarium oxysporum f. sp. conglutinans race 2 54008]KAF6514521.1 hypothetical protein HZS61_005655 [Fusarium oxysporum f. sp. conglutinans]KAG6978400.1 Respiratory supercomplex factor 2-like protein [Fusarium oxysporum f. sp. conglutinans]KAI8400509.1 hypothetical protein FOFC_19351 [Fusarium oxysporum]
MKILTKEEEEAHYAEVVKGGLIGGTLFLGLGLGGVYYASKRYPTFRGLTLPFRAFLVTSTGTFGAIVNAERWSIAYQIAQDPKRNYQDQAARTAQLIRENESAYERFKSYAKENRYPIVFASWLASMGIAFAIVSRQPLNTANKIVQARVYAQGLTLAVLLVSAVFEMNDLKNGDSRWQTIRVVDPNDPTKIIEKKIHKEEYEGQDLWKDMVAAEERRLAAKKQAAGH